MEITLNELKRFMEDPVWRVFKRELMEMSIDVTAGAMKESDTVEIFRAQGRNEVLVDMIKWPDMQIEELERT